VTNKSKITYCLYYLSILNHFNNFHLNVQSCIIWFQDADKKKAKRRPVQKLFNIDEIKYVLPTYNNSK